MIYDAVLATSQCGGEKVIQEQGNSGMPGSSNVAPDRYGSLREGVVRAAVDLCGAYGINLPTSQAPSGMVRSHDHWVTFLAIVGFAGPSVSGNAIFEVDEQILVRSNPTTSSPRDWMAELANQFLGRIKNLLLRQGIPVHRIPPLVVRTCASPLLDGCYGPPVLVMGQQYQGTVTIWVKAEPATPSAGESTETLALTEECDVLAEGEMVLF